MRLIVIIAFNKNILVNVRDIIGTYLKVVFSNYFMNTPERKAKPVVWKSFK